MVPKKVEYTYHSYGEKDSVKLKKVVWGFEVHYSLGGKYTHTFRTRKEARYKLDLYMRGNVYRNENRKTNRWYVTGYYKDLQLHTPVRKYVLSN